jgi:hypothetical protein
MSMAAMASGILGGGLVPSIALAYPLVGTNIT